MMNRKISVVFVGLLLTAFLLSACSEPVILLSDHNEEPGGLVALEPDTNVEAPVAVSEKPAPAHEEESGAHEPAVFPRPAVFRDQIYDRQGEFEKLDADGDGFLSSEEYNGTQQLFDDMDKDGDGQLSLEEAKYMITFAEIPAGTFIMGTDELINAWGVPSTDTSPALEITLDGFKMSSTEITTAQYASYLNSALKAGEIVVSLVDGPDKATRYSYPIPTYRVEGAPGTELAGDIFTYLSPVTTLSHLYALGNPIQIPEHPYNASWIQYSAELERFHVYPGFEDWPAAFIKYWGAQAFVDHYGLSLPTEAEWEYVASGGEQFTYATGDGTIGCDRANYRCYNSQGLPNFQGADTPEEFIGFRYMVGTYPPNPYGVYDLSGNVWEWTMGWYQADFYQYLVDNGITRNPVQLEGEDPPWDAVGGPGQEFSHDARITRGGSYNYHEEVTRTAFRFPTYPFIGNDHFGIRVVLRPETTVFNGTE